jgi:biotin carboxyl carrier protein
VKRVVSIAGMRYALDIQLSGASASFRSGDDALQGASIIETETGCYSILIDGRSYDVRANSTSVSVNGRSFDVEVSDPREMPAGGAAAGTDGRYTLKSLMPGKVVRVLVKEGDTVQAGQGILVIEAMKMQNELKTRRTGVVTALSAREDATVAAGDVLAIVE